MADQVNLGQLYIQIGANTDALTSLPPIIRSLEATLSKLEGSVNTLNTTMSNFYQSVANKATQSAVVISKAAKDIIISEKTKNAEIERAWQQHQGTASSINDAWKLIDKERAAQSKVTASEITEGFRAISAAEKTTVSESKQAWKSAQIEIQNYEAELDNQIRKQAELEARIASAIKRNEEFTKSQDRIGKSAKDSADVFTAGLNEEIQKRKEASSVLQAAIQKNIEYGKSQDRISKSAQESAAVFEKYLKKLPNNAPSRYDLLLGGASAHLSASTSRARNLGSALQNIGYQTQDIIVQLEAGASLSRTLGQQVPQLLGGFGVWGALAGAVAAGMAALIPYVLKLGDESEKAAEKQRKYNDALASAKPIIDKLGEAQAKLEGKLPEFKLKDLQEQREKIEKELRDFKPGFFTGFAGKKEIEDRLFQVTQAQTLARRALAKEPEVNLQIDINRTKNILAQTAAYNKGTISLREYGIQKKLIEELDSLGIKKDSDAAKLLKTRIRLQTELNEKEQQVKITRDIQDLNIKLNDSNQILEKTAKSGINAGEELKQFLSDANKLKDYTRILEDLGPKQTRFEASLLGISTAGLSEEEILDRVAKKLTDMSKGTDDATASTNNLIEVQKTVASLSDRIAGVKAGGGIAGQMFAPELFKRASDFEKRTREIQRNLEFKVAAGDSSAVINSMNEYKKVVDEVGMADPFAGVKPENTRAVAEGIAKVEQSVGDLEQRSVKVASAISQIISQAASLFGQLSSMYAEQAAYHKQMAEEALSYGRSQAELYMQLADAVHYSNNAQAQSYEQKAIAAAESASKQYQAEKQAQAKSNELARQNFENQKKLQIVQAIASTAAAVAGQLAMQPVGPWNIALASAMGILGAAQVAIISKQQYTPRETGGSIYGNQNYIVGESGPEIFVPGRSGTMISQKEIMAGLAGGNNGGTSEVHFHINAIDTQSAAQVIMQNRGMIEGIIVQANNRRMRS